MASRRCRAMPPPRPARQRFRWPSSRIIPHASVMNSACAERLLQQVLPGRRDRYAHTRQRYGHSGNGSRLAPLMLPH